VFGPCQPCDRYGNPHTADGLSPRVALHVETGAGVAKAVVPVPEASYNLTWAVDCGCYTLSYVTVAGTLVLSVTTAEGDPFVASPFHAQVRCVKPSTPLSSERSGVVSRSRAILCRRGANLNVTIRNCCICTCSAHAALQLTLNHSAKAPLSASFYETLTEGTGALATRFLRRRRTRLAPF
jgi:hypothetical protein